MNTNIPMKFMFWTILTFVVMASTFALRVSQDELPEIKRLCSLWCAPHISQCLKDHTCPYLNKCVSSCSYGYDMELGNTVAGKFGRRSSELSRVEADYLKSIKGQHSTKLTSLPNFSMCSIGCTIRHKSPKSKVVSSCLLAKKCISIKSHGECPRLYDPHQVWLLGLRREFMYIDIQEMIENNPNHQIWDLLMGEDWLVVRGLGDNFDRWDCQSVKLGQDPSTGLSRITTSIYVDRKRSDIHFFQQNGGDIANSEWIFELDVGLYGTVRFHLVAKAADFALIYYCGQSELIQSFQGAWVLSRKSPEIGSTFTGQGAMVLPLDVVDFFNFALRDQQLHVVMDDFGWNVQDERSCHFTENNQMDVY